VTANKALLAHAGPEIVRRAVEAGVGLGFEASVCGGVPVIGALRTGLAGNEIRSVVGIVNGTCNYILTRMSREGAPYAEALAAAQAKGYAEADPAFDVEGLDSAHKLAVLAALSFGTPVNLDDIPFEGISRLDVADVRYAEDLGYAVKLLAIGKRRGEGTIELRVHPTLVPKAHPLAAVSDVFNAAEFVGDSTGRVMFYGRGAGREPTASAVVADLIEAARGHLAATTRELAFWAGDRALAVAPPGDAASRFYVRFTARDEFGVLGRVAEILGRHRVSIASVIQKEPARDVPGGRGVPIVMLTHEARERDFEEALREIGALDFITRESVFLHIEE
jgi:homoserine dehydrogenase